MRKKNITEVLPFRIGIRDLNSPHIWREIQVENYKIEKPVIICLGGNCSTNFEKANGFCKLACDLIGLKAKEDSKDFASIQDVDVVGISYGDNGKGYGELSGEEIKEIVNNLFVPLITNKKGANISEEQLCKNLGNVTFFSHCWGSRETYKMVMSLTQKMLVCGYPQSTIDKSLAQVVSVSYSPNTTHIPQITSFSIRSLKDSINTSFSYNYAADVGEENCDQLKGLKLTTNKKFGIETAGSFSLYSDELTKGFSSDGEKRNVLQDGEHSVRVIKRDSKWNLTDELDGRKYYYGKNADYASQCAAYVLASSVATALNNNANKLYTPKPSATEYIVALNDIISGASLSSSMDSNMERS